jgi:hypothetical protein
MRLSEQFTRVAETEHGWQARDGLQGRLSPQVRNLLRAKNFQPVDPMEVVPVAPCPFCDDGGLRIAGYVQRNLTPVPVRQCDTCHTAEVGIQVFVGDLHLSPGDGAPA